jgi:Lon protease-like protein
VTRRIPLFPLPGVVLLPGTTLPLHIFEARYRAMVAVALAGDRTIGMAMLKPGWEAADEDPRIYSIGGAGEIVDSEQLDDGR